MFRLRIRVLPVLLIVMLFLALVPMTDAQGDDPPAPQGLRPDAPAYGVRGLYPVGFMTFSDEADERPMEGGIWYPAVNPEGIEEAITYDLGLGDILPPLESQPGRAILDGLPDTANGPYPLVISSHGMGARLRYRLPT